MQGIAQKILENPGRYSIQELQRGVQDGIIPAYIAVPLIQEKVQMQKQMQMAQAMQQPPVQNQPPIAAQVMQEAQGVQALPTNLPAEYAGGGIVAFADNKDQPVSSDMPSTDSGPFTGPLAWLFGQPTLTPTEEARRRRLQDEATARAAAANVPRVETPYDPRTATRRVEYEEPKPEATPAPGMREPSITAPVGSPSARAAGIGALLQRPQGSMADTAQRLYGDLETREAERQQALEGKRAQLMGSVPGEAYEEYKKSLEDEAKQMGADREDAKYMAMFKAGLAIMAGTSPYALQNIGKGAMVGVEDYQAAVSDLKKAQKENQKQLAFIEQARRAEARGDRDKQLDYLERADAAKSKRDLHGTDAVARGFGMDQEMAEKQWEAITHRQTQLDVANIGAGATLGAANARLQALLGGAGTKGGFTAEQLSKEFENAKLSPEFAQYRKTLIDQKGKNAEKTPEFQDALNRKLAELVRARVSQVGEIRGGAPAAPAQPNAALQQLLSDPSVAKYLNP